MDVEFHYYMTYLIAARAGFAPDEALLIAYSSQSVDDNHTPIVVDKGNVTEYKNCISQTMDITRPHFDETLYPVFHFVPGDIDSPTAFRADGAKSAWITTPNSKRAQQLLNAAFASRDLYRIGICTHVYADTWAHQNFIGRRDELNTMPLSGELEDELVQGLLDQTIDVGHGAAKHMPDQPGLIWTDKRLTSSNIINRDRFVDAAEHLFFAFTKYKGRLPKDEVELAVESLRQDLTKDIGAVDESDGDGPEARIARYIARTLQPEYGATPLPAYSEHKWFDAALSVDGCHDALITTLRGVLEQALGSYKDLVQKGARISCSWKSPDDYQHTDWYLFQEAVKAHGEFGIKSLQALLDDAQNRTA